jgi:peptide/nickel transport system substrate-binding protein
MRSLRSLLLTLVGLALAATATFVLARQPRASATPTPAPRTGGHIVVGIRGEPRTVTRLHARDRTSSAISHLTQARLVRLHPVTTEPEPSLAESWETSDDGKTLTLHLRRGVTFSDGAPFTAADVLFTFKALYDPGVASHLARVYTAGDRPFDVSAPDSHTVIIRLAEPFAPALRLLDALTVLPAHHLAPALADGTLAARLGVASPQGRVPGLGPFMLKHYVAGERVELERNPRYWRTEQDARLPYLDRITLRIVPDQSTEFLRLESGELDVLANELRPDDIPAARRLEASGKARLFELGPGLDAEFLWFNLRQGSDDARPGGGRPAPWLRSAFRHAVSLAVNRRQLVDTVLLGAGTPISGPITPANRTWFAPGLHMDGYDRAHAAELLRSCGLADRDADGLLDHADGSRFSFTILTQEGHAIRKRAAAVIKEDLRKLGLRVDVVALDLPALIDRLTRGQYDAAYFGVSASDTDPSANLDYWLSSGSFHIWNPSQRVPATAWEREIDGLMRRLTVRSNQAERKALFDQTLRVFAAERPAIYFAAPNLTFITSTRVASVQPSVLWPQILWNADTLRVVEGAGTR